MATRQALCSGSDASLHPQVTARLCRLRLGRKYLSLTMGNYRSASLALAALTTTTLLGAGTALPAHADSGEIAAVQARVAELEQISADASNRAVAKRVELAAAEQRLLGVREELTTAREVLAREQRNMSAIARQLYVSGGVEAAASGFALDNAEDFIDDLERSEAAGSAQATVVGRTRAAAEEVRRAEEALAAEQRALAEVAAQLDTERDAAAAALNEAQKELARLEEEERQRIAAAIAAAREAARIAAEQEAARQRAEAEARARAEAEAAAARAQEEARQAAERAAVAAAVVDNWRQQANAAAAAAEAEAAASRAAIAAGVVANWQAQAAASAQTYQAPAAAPEPSAPSASSSSTSVSSSGSAPGGSDVASWADSSYSQAIKFCESSGNYSINTGNGYYGAWQFDYPSWHWNGGGQFAEYPHQATKEQQDYVAWTYYQRAGWRPWECSLKVG